MNARVTVHIVDDDTSYLTAVSRLLRAHGFEVQTFASGAELLARITGSTRGCVVADLHMPGLDGLELQHALTASAAPLPVVFLSGQGDIASTVRAMRQGAVDFLEKHAPEDALLAAVQRAIERDSVDRAARERQRELRRRFDALSPREREVLSHVVRGRMNKQIAADLGIHERTVKLHRTTITRKLGVPSVAKLATLVQEAGLFNDES
jgi:FixJ family two-component response regulator